jgi:hypothetical protein
VKREAVRDQHERHRSLADELDGIEQHRGQLEPGDRDEHAEQRPDDDRVRERRAQDSADGRAALDGRTQDGQRHRREQQQLQQHDRRRVRGIPQQVQRDRDADVVAVDVPGRQRADRRAGDVAP